MPTRDDAWNLLCEYTKGDSLRKHALAVEAVMRDYAHRLNEDEAKWGMVGLLHDFDYEMYPDAPDHPVKGSEILAEQGYASGVRWIESGHDVDHGGLAASVRTDEAEDFTTMNVEAYTFECLQAPERTFDAGAAEHRAPGSARG